MDHSLVEELADTTFDLGFFGNVFIRQRECTVRGQVLPGHQHQYAHATFVGVGEVDVLMTCPDGTATTKRYQAPAWFEVPADVTHRITCLSDRATLYCVFAIRDADGQVAEMVREWHTDHQAFAARV